jgi:hypothetical protein
VASSDTADALGAGLHVVNGAAFGALFAAFGGHGWRRGVAAAELENLASWPAMIVADRQHPDRRTGRWPPLARSPRVFAQEALAHALFGAIMGALIPPRRHGERVAQPGKSSAAPTEAQRHV